MPGTPTSTLWLSTPTTFAETAAAAAKAPRGASSSAGAGAGASHAGAGASGTGAGAGASAAAGAGSQFGCKFSLFRRLPSFLARFLVLTTQQTCFLKF